MIAALALTGFGTTAMAMDNEPEEGITYSAQVGMNVSGLRVKNNAALDMNKKVGANLGFYGRYVLPSCHGTYMKLGVRYNMLGAKKSVELPGNNEIDTKVALHYIDIPLHVGFQYGVTEDWDVYADFGPYFGVGVVGKSKVKSFVNDNLVTDTHNNWYGDGTGDANMKQFDCGIGFNVGTEYMKHYILNMGCDWGLTDQMKDKVYGRSPKCKNFNFSLSVGYRF